MAFVDTMRRFAAPGPFGSTNLRAALASAREAGAASPPVPIPGQAADPIGFAHPQDPEAGAAEGTVIAKSGVPLAADPESMPATDTLTPKPQIPALPGDIATPELDAPDAALFGPSGLVVGTPIKTESGTCNVEDLRPGDQVLTADAGAVPVRWVAQFKQPTSIADCPVRFARNVLQNDIPLCVAPMQRVLISGPAVKRLNGQSDAMIAAHALVDRNAITRLTAMAPTYVLVMLDSHQLIWAGNSLVDSFYPDVDRLATLPADVLRDFVREMPDLADDPDAYGAPVRPILHELEAIAHKLA